MSKTPACVEAFLNEQTLSAEQSAELRQWVNDNMNQAAQLERKIRKQEFEFSTILEASNLIHAKAVDNLNVEEQLNHQIKFLINTAKGYFGVSNVAMLEHEHHMGRMNQVVLGLYRGTQIDFTVSHDFSHALATNLPIELDNPHEAFAQCDTELNVLRENKIAVAVPLLADSVNMQENRLVGMLCFGRRFTGEAFTPGEIRFMGLIGNMLGIAMHNAHMHQRSIVDSLTQVFSRGYFDMYLDKEITRARRVGTANPDQEPPKLSLIMLDIDHFKSFNDTYGHQVGDEVLTLVSSILQESVRHNDIVARYGGEEFGVIAPGADKKVGFELAERIRERIAETPITVSGEKVSITASLGLSEFPTDANDPRDIVSKADLSLYAAKGQGRNCVVGYDPSIGN